MAKILIIDDSEVIRSLLIDFLTDLGHSVEFAVDGQQGIDMALDDEFSLIICDVHMPKKNGFLVFKEIMSKRPATNFIMTDSLPGDLADRVSQKGIKHLLAKPFDLDQLRATLDEVLKPVRAK